MKRSQWIKCAEFWALGDCPNSDGIPMGVGVFPGVLFRNIPESETIDLDNYWLLACQFCLEQAEGEPKS